ncbi:MAG: S1C family serine protease [Clostridia bacterium]
MDYEKENDKKYGENAYEPVRHVWHEDESTMWQKEPVNESSFSEEPAASAPYEEPFQSTPPSDSGRPQKPPRKRFPWKTFWKTIGISAAALLLIFNTATSAFLLSDYISDRHTVAQATPEVSASSSDNVTTASSTGNELSVAEINTKVSPSVVLISGKNMQGEGQGTGVIITEDGYIVTNAHVVSGFSELTVTLNDENNTEYPATVVGTDETTDIAVIRINASGLTPAELGTSATLQVGQSVVVIGNPLGKEFSGSVTTGVISALDRQVEFEDGSVYNYIQTDAAINSGNSGGPLVNMQGQVIGINAAKIDTSVAEGMGFAIPIDDVVPVVNDLMEYGYVTDRPYIGIGGEGLNEQYASFYNLPQGVHVLSIEEGSPAAKSELQVDDIITHINGVEINSVGQLNNVKNKCKPGDTVELTVYRYSTEKTFTVKVELAEMPRDVQ